MQKVKGFSIALVLLMDAGLIFGQATNSADVTGSVTDPTGAVVQGVKITVKDLDKSVEHVIVSNDAGLYDTGPIVPNDNYTITFSREGFETLQRGPMVLQVGITGMNAMLTVGQQTQQVVVNEAAPLLETQTGERSTTLATDTLESLPQTGTPDWQSFVILQPGVSGNNSTTTTTGTSAVSNPGMGDAAANGAMPFSTAMLDGSSVSSPMSDNVINTPIFDTIAEVKMSNSNFSAQYGTGGIIYNQISKGGSNTIHGLAYDYFRNTALNAANYGFGSGVVPVIHWNDFGFQLSGPVIRNKLFLLFDWDHTINHGGASLQFSSLPTPAETAGDFSAPGLPTLYDPTHQTVVNGVVTRPSFISETGANKIPAALLDPAAQKIAALFPTTGLNPNATVNNYSFIAPANSTLQKWFGRFDYDPFASNHLTGSTAYNYTNSHGASPVAPVNVTNVDVENMSGQLSDVHTFSSRTINEARSGWMGEYDLLTSPTIGEGYPAKLGLQYAKADIFPTINISGITGLGATSPSVLAPGIHANYRENVFDESDVLTMIRGRHTLHFGGELLFFRADSTAWGNINAGTFGFTGVYTQQGNTPGTTVGGSGYADFLLGYVQSWSASVSPVYYGRLKNPAFFVQDDFKFSPKLVLNLGLRWEGRTGWSDSSKNQRAFDPTIINPATGTAGAMWYALTHVNGRTRLEENRWNNWLPRIGAAYQYDNKTVLRGGFGIYTFPWNVDNYAGCCMGNAIASSGSEVDSTGNTYPVGFLSGTGNENPQGAAGSSINTLYVHSPTTPQAYNGQSVPYIQYKQPLPNLYGWNLTIQRQVASNMVADVAYVGSHAKNLLFNTDLNQVPVGKLAPNDASSRPYPEFQSISGIQTVATSDYHALQAQIERRMSNGLMFNFNYTWSHMTDDQDSSGWGGNTGTSVFQNAYVPQANHGAANYDVRQMFKAYGSYQLPFGSGRQFLNNNRLLDEAIGGWTMSLTWLGQGGHPFTPTMLVNNSYASTNAASDFKWFPNQVGNPKSGTHGTIHEWFNVGAFEQPTPGTLGDTRRNSVYGPGLYVMNGAIRKSFPIFERVNFEFTANATNLLNHASFSNPDTVIGPGHNAQITSVSEGGRIVELVGKIRF